MNPRRLIASVRNADGDSFDYYHNDTPRQVGVDGFGNAVLGTAVCKIEMYQTLGTFKDQDITVEEREQIVTLSVPTKALVEFCDALLSTISANRESFEKGTQRDLDRILAISSQYGVAEKS